MHIAIKIILLTGVSTPKTASLKIYKSDNDVKGEIKFYQSVNYPMVMGIKCDNHLLQTIELESGKREYMLDESLPLDSFIEVIIINPKLMEPLYYGNTRASKCSACSMMEGFDSLKDSTNLVKNEIDGLKDYINEKKVNENIVTISKGLDDNVADSSTNIIANKEDIAVNVENNDSVTSSISTNTTETNIEEIIKNDDKIDEGSELVDNFNNKTDSNQSTVMETENQAPKSSTKKYSNKGYIEIDGLKLGEKPNNRIKGNFFKKIEKKLMETFSENEKNEDLLNMIPYSKWVKVLSGDTFYLTGIIYNENEEPSYIAYAVKGDADFPPDTDGSYQYFDTENGGYWIVFQDAETGDVIKAKD